jgi:uncharacterized phage protein (TIGR02216 family)
MEDNNYLPWRNMLEAAYGILGFSPDIFWQMTPGEYALAISGWRMRQGFAQPNQSVIERAELDNLREKFPD